MSQNHSLSISTVQRKLENQVVKQPVPPPRKVVVIMDTMYFRRSYGVMVFRDWYKRENLLWKYVDYETIAGYKLGIEELQARGFSVAAIVADGRRGIFSCFKGIPIQMCQFHQMQAVRRYITANPKLQAGVELKTIVDRLTRTDEDSFKGWLRDWHTRWGDFLKEKSLSLNTGKWSYTHARIRSAYFSLVHNLPYLFTCHKNPGLDIPNTTNSLDGSFAHVKDKLRIHRGLKRHRKQKLISELLTKNVT